MAGHHDRRSHHMCHGTAVMERAYSDMGLPSREMLEADHQARISRHRGTGAKNGR